MNASHAIAADAAAAHSSLRSYLLEARYECLRLLRTPSFALPSLLFPPLFYLLFGVLLNKSSGDAARYLLATYGVFGVMGAGLFAFGVTVALEREQGFLIYKRALPMPPGAYLFAKMAMAMVFAMLISLLLSILAATVGGVDLRVQVLDEAARLDAEQRLGTGDDARVGEVHGDAHGQREHL